MVSAQRKGVCIYNGEEIVNYKNYSQLLNRSVTNYTVNHITGTDEGGCLFLRSVIFLSDMI